MWLNGDWIELTIQASSLSSDGELVLPVHFRRYWRAGYQVPPIHVGVGVRNGSLLVVIRELEGRRGLLFARRLLLSSCLGGAGRLSSPSILSSSSHQYCRISECFRSLCGIHLQRLNIDQREREFVHQWNHGIGFHLELHE